MVINGTSLYTVDELAVTLGVPVHVATYALKSRRMEASHRVGIIRLFSEETLAVLRLALGQDPRPSPNGKPVRQTICL